MVPGGSHPIGRQGWNHSVMAPQEFKCLAEIATWSARGARSSAIAFLATRDRFRCHRFLIVVFQNDAPEEPTMFHPRLSLVVVLLGTGIGTLAQEAPMLYYPLDEGRGRVAADASGNKLDGVVTDHFKTSHSGSNQNQPL